MLCELSLLFNKKEDEVEQFPEVVGNSHYDKLWNHLDKRESRHFGWTKYYPSHNRTNIKTPNIKRHIF